MYLYGSQRVLLTLKGEIEQTAEFSAELEWKLENVLLPGNEAVAPEPVDAQSALFHRNQ